MRSTVTQLVHNWHSWFRWTEEEPELFELSEQLKSLAKEDGTVLPQAEMLAGGAAAAMASQKTTLSKQERLVVSVRYVQIDNQAMYASLPVVLSPRVTLEEQSEAHATASSSARPTLKLEYTRFRELGETINLQYFSLVDVHIEPISVQLEDFLLTNLMRVADEFDEAVEDIFGDDARSAEAAAKVLAGNEWDLFWPTPTLQLPPKLVFDKLQISRLRVDLTLRMSTVSVEQVSLTLARDSACETCGCGSERAL